MEAVRVYTGDMIGEFFNKYIDGVQDVAVAVSGGADSMALCFMLAEYLFDNSEITIHALTVDHGLRVEAGAEALYVGEQLKRFSNVNHHILKWDHGGDRPYARVQELARVARYELMESCMAEHGLKYLFLGHHMGDQAETFLFRLAKGSGVDGLSCMADMQERDFGVVICRPMLDVHKDDLIALCEYNKIEYIDDPSNYSDIYARVRLRKSMEVLEREGLTLKRLSVCASRHARARGALEFIANKVFKECVINKDSDRIVFNYDILLNNPEEIVLRIVLLAMSELNGSKGYGARMEKVENLCSDLVHCEKFRKRTLGGVIFERDYKNNKFTLYYE